jgi:hypothetical protein
MQAAFAAGIGEAITQSRRADPAETAKRARLRGRESEARRLRRLKSPREFLVSLSHGGFNQEKSDHLRAHGHLFIKSDAGVVRRIEFSEPGRGRPSARMPREVEIEEAEEAYKRECWEARRQYLNALLATTAGRNRRDQLSAAERQALENALLSWGSVRKRQAGRKNTDTRRKAGRLSRQDVNEAAKQLLRQYPGLCDGGRVSGKGLARLVEREIDKKRRPLSRPQIRAILRELGHLPK